MKLVIDTNPPPAPERMCINCENRGGKDFLHCKIDDTYIGYMELWNDKADCPDWRSKYERHI